MKKITMGIMGASGRMGRMLIKAVMNHPDADLVGAYVRPSNPLIGIDAGNLVGEQTCHVPLSSLSDCQTVPDVLIDFSLPHALDEVLDFCAKHDTRLVMGVTGLDDTQEQKLKQAADQLAIVYAGNYSTGVNLSLNLLATTAKTLGMSADVEIIESHHKHKQDAPSGTALMMAKAVAQARHQNPKDAVVNGRAGISQRKTGDIGIHAVRGGEIVGEHRVKFIMDGELIEIIHKAQSRDSFAVGAVRAGVWLSQQAIGLYDMQEVLGLKPSNA